MLTSKADVSVQTYLLVSKLPEAQREVLSSAYANGEFFQRLPLFSGL